MRDGGEGFPMKKNHPGVGGGEGTERGCGRQIETRVGKWTQQVGIEFKRVFFLKK